jgi:ADP-L-glycero-D-manno-heptose 6-epimerase
MYSKKIDFNNKNILITGGAGFIGSNLAHFFQKNYPASNVVVFDCFRSQKNLDSGNLKSFGHYKNLIGFKGNIVCGDINEESDLEKLNKYKFDFIFHYAAISDTRVYDQEIIMRTNVNSFNHFLEISKSNKATLIYASSAAVYGSIKSPQREGQEAPENPYGFSKYIMDEMANNFSILHPDLRIIGLRFFNVYGPGEFYKGKTSSMIIQLGHQIMNELSPRLFHHSDQIFRDFIYIDDVIQANIMACNCNHNGSYNIGTGVSRSFQDVSDILQKVLKTNYSTEYFPNPFEGYQTNTKANISQSTQYLNFKPKYTLEKGIKAYLPEIKRLHGIRTNE